MTWSQVDALPFTTTAGMDEPKLIGHAWHLPLLKHCQIGVYMQMLQADY